MPTFATKSPDKKTLFSQSPDAFGWAVGIEDTFIGQTDRLGERVLDEYALTHHYLYWREDIDRAANLGINSMRYGIPWYKVEPNRGQFDWSWMDRVLEYAAEKGIAIIADLMHYGTPLWLDNQFLNSSYPARVAAYEGEFARRYRHIISHYTPLNEPLVTMDFCGERALWPPYLRGSDGSVKILRQLARGIALSVQALRQADPDAKIVHVEAAGEFIPDAPEQCDAAQFLTRRARIAVDLLAGLVDKHHPLVGWLLEHGMSDLDLAWHSENSILIDLLGVNYYPDISVYRVRNFGGTAGTEHISAGAAGLKRCVQDFWERYHRPIMLTETSKNGTLEERSPWLTESVSPIAEIRGQGIPLVGYTWWPLFDLIDWVYRESTAPIERFMARQGPISVDLEQIGKMIHALQWNPLE